MTAADLTGICVLVYATVASVWTLCERRTTDALRELVKVERPSSIPAWQQEAIKAKSGRWNR